MAYTAIVPVKSDTEIGCVARKEATNAEPVIIKLSTINIL